MKRLCGFLCVTLLLSSMAARGELELTGISIKKDDDKKKSTVEGKQDETKKATKVEPDIVSFLNDDRLHGTLLGADMKSGLVWRSPDSTEPITFKLENIVKVSLGDPQRRPVNASVVLTNGDTLKGRIIKMGTESMTLETWYAGTLELKRVMVKSITPGTSSGAVFSGPRDLATWKTRDYNRLKVELEDATMILPRRCFAGKDVKLPDRARIDFEVPYGSQLSFFMYADKLERHGLNCYMMNISSSYLYAQRYTNNRGSDSIGQANYQNSDDDDSVRHYTFLVDKKDKRIVFMLNGRLIKEFKDNKDFASEGTAISFYNNGSVPLKVSNIMVYSWDGRIPNPTGADEELPKDTIVFANDDKVTGTLNGIAEGKAQFKTEFADLTVPLERIRLITLATEDQELARKRKNDIRMYFNDNQWVTVDFTSIADGTIKGASENFGEAGFRLRAFNQLDFNLYRIQEEEENDE